MKRIYMFISSMLVVVLYGCKDMEYNSEYVPSPAKLFLTVDTENFDFSPNATSGYFNINAGRNYWRIENNAPWVQLSTEQGHGPWGIELSVQKNESSEKDRASIINVKSEEGNWYTCIPILVHQAKADPYISIGEYDYVVSGFSHAIDIDVRANIDWTVSCDEEWAVVGTSGVNRNRITVYMTENRTRESRKVNITFHGIISKMITITQRPLNITSSAGDPSYVHTNDSNIFEIMADQECNNIPASTENVLIGNTEESSHISIGKSDEWNAELRMNMKSKACVTELSLNSRSAWTANVDGEVDWIDVSPANEGENSVMNIAVKDNNTSSTRCAKIYLSANDSYVYIINVTQQGCEGSK